MMEFLSSNVSLICFAVCVLLAVIVFISYVCYAEFLEEYSEMKGLFDKFTEELSKLVYDGDE